MVHMTNTKRAFIVLAAAALFAITGCKGKTQQNPDPNAQQAPVAAAAQDANAAANTLPKDDSLPLVLRLGVLPVKGNLSAPVTIVEFSDYECPFCSRAEPTIKQLLTDMPNDVRVAFINMPLPMHKNAESAAKAALAAGKQGKYWEMHEKLFANQRALNDGFYESAAKEIGINVDQFKADMNSKEIADMINASKAAGQPYGIGGTPSFLINGVVFVGAQPIEKFKEVINQELARAKAVAAEKKLSGEALYQELVKTAPKPAPRPERQPEPIVTGRAAVDLSTAPALGPEDAPVTLVEFTDFECPFCSRGNTTIHQLIDANPGKIRLYFRHYPLPFHRNAKLAHQAAEAAKNQGKFWEMYDLLFANQKKADGTTGLDEASIMGYATQIGLDMDKFKADLTSDATIKIVDADIAAGSAAGVNGTPHFLLNGTELSGAQPLPAFQAALDKELEAAKPYIEKGLTGRAIYEQMAKDDPRKVVRPQAPEAKPAAPAAPIVLDAGNAPFKGAADAPVTIFQFSEFQCPFCSRVEPTLDALMNDPAYAGKIKIIFKQFPLGFHANAQKAAEAALFANDNGKFWELHKIMFENQKALDIDSILGYAKQVGLDADALKAALDSNKYADAVNADVKAGQGAGISGTPSFVINGKLVVGALPVENFKKEIDEALAKAGK